jgi:hypothetical protein
MHEIIYLMIRMFFIPTSRLQGNDIVFSSMENEGVRQFSMLTDS